MTIILTLIIIAIIFNNMNILDNIIKGENYVKKNKSKSTKSNTKITTKERNKKNNTTERRSMDK